MTMEISGLLERALNIRGFYHKVLASNIANIETPGYKEKDVDFVTELERSMKGSTSDVEVRVKSDPGGIDGIDGNSVNLEDQIVKLSENSMMFNAFVQLINKKFSMMRYVINEGRR
jgi:flagellar basal-body rod protein FlgB